MHRFLRLRSLALFGGLALTAAACSDGPSEPSGPDPASITITGGDGQEAATNAAVAVAPTVRVLDENGGAVSGVTVTFQVLSGGGSVTGATPSTNATGYASVGSWTLGPTGGENTLRATVSGLAPVTFTATAVAPTATPANVTLYVGGGQSAQVSTPVAASPTVLVTDGGGQPVQFAQVTFSVQGGGGSLTGAVQTTDENGLARVGSWKLGATPGVNTLRATVAGVTPLDVTATGTTLDAAGFNVTLRFISLITPAQYAVFEAARERWEEVITGELTNLDVANQVFCSGTPAVTERIDDVVIFINLIEIDGPGSVLGSAGPCAIRTSNGLPLAGVMNFDTADLAAMSDAFFRDVILHEMGHVLGVGSLWNTTDPVRTLLTDGGTVDPYFIGAGAVAAFDAAGGTTYVGNKVPVEGLPATQGTIDSHWREAVFANELMTGWISSVSANPLSAITIASLADMGYTVNAAAADAYVYTSGVRLNAGEMLQPITEAPIADPILIMDEGGRVTRRIARP